MTSVGLSSSPSFLSSRPSTGDIREQVCAGLELKHGLLSDYQCRVSCHIKSVIFHPRTQSTIVHHTAGFNVYSRGRVDRSAESADLAKRVECLLYDEVHDVYVGVCARALVLISAEFECVYEHETEERVACGVINTWSGEVVTCGVGNVTSFMFRKGGKIIAPSLVITDGLCSDETVRMVHLETVPGKAQRCFAVLETGVKVYLMSSGKLLASLEDLHSRTISAILFFRPLRLLITAAKDGGIKVWNSDWSLACTFVGHCGVVTCLSPNPHGPMVLSGSRDCTIRVWNLLTHDQVEILPHTTPVEGVHCVPGVYHLLSHSSRQLKGWRVEQLYHQSALTGPVSFLRGTTHPLVPLRVLAACADSAIRVISPVTSETLSTALLPMKRRVVSLAFFSFKEVLHVLDDEGLVSVFDTRNNPSTLLASWAAPKHLNIGEYSCLALYEVASDEEEVEESLAADKWLGVTLEARQLAHVQLTTDSPLDKRREGYNVLLAGTSEGCVTLLESSGEVTHFKQGPSGGAITHIACNPHRRQVITAGPEGGLDVWQLYPHAIEPLSHFYSFSLSSSSPPSLFVSTRDRLCVASNSSSLASYTLDMFDLTEKVTYTSEADSSHTDTITSLDAAPKLKLFASSSLDATLRIWTDENHPVRVLRLDGPPTGMAFCSLQADIVLALHSHLHIITHSTYFNESLRKQLVSIRFSELKPESAREWCVDVKSLPEEDRRRLELVDHTISQDDYSGALSEEEVVALQDAVRAKDLCLQIIGAREEEIRAIREGLLTASGKKSERVPLKGKEKEQFWRELLALLRPGEPHLRVHVPIEDRFNPDGPVSPSPPPDAPYEKGPRYKFFPPLATFEPPYPLAPDGYLPNSVLLKSLRKSEADQELAKGWSPPTISDKQRRLLQEMEELEEEEEEAGSEHDDDLMSRLQAALLAKSPTPSPSPPPTPSPPPPPTKKVMVPKKPIQKLIAPKAPPPKPPTPPRTPTPPPPKSPTPPPTPPPPPTPLPEYIAQFIGQSWFDKLFPNASSKTFPKPWTVTQFVYTLLRCLSKPVDSITKGDICSALLKLVLQYNPGNKSEIYSSVLSLLTTPPPPSPRSMAERHLILAALKLLFQLSESDLRLTALMMTHYVLGDSELRRLVANQLISQGLVDPEGYFERLLVSVRKEEGVEGVMVWTERWLNEWAGQLATSRGTNLLKAPQPAKKALKSSSPAGAVGRSRSKVSFAKKSASPVTPVMEPMSVINYYVTVEHENELARKRVVTPPPPPPAPEDELPHNTVVSLPKISRGGGLIRLGETHCSCCHPHRETSLALFHGAPPLYNTRLSSDPTKLWKHFTHCLTLALTPQNVNPFLTEEEQRAERELGEYSRAQRLTAGSAARYFVVERTQVNSDQ